MVSSRKPQFVWMKRENKGVVGSPNSFRSSYYEDDRGGYEDYGGHYEDVHQVSSASQLSHPRLILRLQVGKLSL